MATLRSGSYHWGAFIEAQEEDEWKELRIFMLAATVKQTSIRMTKSLFTFLYIAVFASCSTYHMYTKEEAIKVAKKRDIKKDGSIVIEDENRILKILARDSNYQKLDEIYQFNDDGKQLKYTIIASCDSCFQKYLLKEMNNHGYKWKKLNDSTYVSKYNFKRFLNVHKSTFSFEIVQHNLSKKEYENLIQIAEK